MKLKAFLTLLSCMITFPTFSQTGASGDPFTALGQAWSVSSSGTYYFNISGTSFSTYVESGSGWILIASGDGTTTESSYSTTTALTLQSDEILSSIIYTSVLVTDVRMNASSGPETPFDVTSNNSGILTNLQSDRTLSVSTNQSAWSGTNVAKVNPICGSSSTSLSLNIFHSGCDGSAMHWQPASSIERVNHGSTANDLNLWIRATSVAVFPIDLNYFEAASVNDFTVELSWETLQEINNDYFSIERSTTESNWEEIATMQSVGNTSAPITYSYIDQNVHFGTLFYRLRQTDLDGHSSLSSTQMINLADEDATTIKIFPNPAQTTLTVEGNPQALSRIRILDLMGQSVKNQVGIRNRSEYSIEFDVSHLPAGIYTIVTESSSGIFYKQ